MTQIVQTPDGESFGFPDEMARPDIERAIKNRYGLAAPATPKAQPPTATQAQPVAGSSFESEMMGAPVEPPAPTSVLDSFEARSAPPMPAAVPPAKQFTTAQARLTGRPAPAPVEPPVANWREDLTDLAMGREVRPAPMRQPTVGEIVMQQPKMAPGEPRVFGIDDGQFHGTPAEFEKEHGRKTGVLDNAANYPERWTYGASADIAAAQRWLTQVDAEIARNDAIARTGRTSTPEPDPMTGAPRRGIIDRAASADEVARAQAELPRLRAERDRLEMIRSGAKAAEMAVTPRDESTLSKAVGTVGRSSASTLAGVATGMVLGPAAGYAVGVGLGATQQGAGSFADAIEAGRDAKARIAQFDAQPDRIGYLRALLADGTAPDTVKKSAMRVTETIEDIDAKMKGGLLSSRAARQMTERALGSFKRDLDFIAKGADAGHANLTAGIDAIAEGVGEAIGLGPFMRTMKLTGLAKSGFLPSFVEAVAVNYGQEYATQLMQTLNARMRADPNVTLKEALEQAHEAGVAGAVMGGALHPPLYAAGKAAAKAGPYGGEYPGQPAPGFTPTPSPAAAAVRKAFQPGTEMDLASVLADKRPLKEIRAEQAQQETEALAPQVQELAGAAAQQELQTGEQKDAAAEAAGIPRRGEQAIVTWPDGEVQRVTILDLYQDTNPATGEPMTGAMVELENGQTINLTTADAKISAPPLGEGTPASPIVAETPAAIEQAGARAAADKGNLYEISNPIGRDEPMQVKVVRHASGAVALVSVDDGQLSDVSDMINAGFPIEKAIAMTFGDHPQGSEPDLSKVRKIDGGPTPAQAEAGNYRKGHVDFQGLNITIENPKGTVRSSKDPDRPWQVTMPAHYGYVKRTEGADGDQVDVYIGDVPQSQQVWIVDQIDPATKKFDEHKVMLGFPTAVEAMRAYRAAFQNDAGAGRVGKITHTSMAGFKTMLKSTDWTKPIAYVEPQPTVRELALERQREAGWNTDWPFVPVDLVNADFRRLIAADPGLSQDEKERIFAAGKKLGVVPADEKLKGEQGAETIRGDQGQDGQGRAEGQPGVQPGAEPRGGDLQQPTPVTTDVGGASGGGATGGGYQKPVIQQPRPPVTEPGKEEKPDGDSGVPREGTAVDVQPPAPPVAPPPVQPPTPPVAEPPAPPVAPETPKEPVAEKPKKERPEIPSHIAAFLRERGADPAKIRIITTADGLESAFSKWGAANKLPGEGDRPTFGAGPVYFQDDEQDGKVMAITLVDPMKLKGAKAALTASEKLHGEILDALENNDRDAMGKLIYQDVPVTDETRPQIDPGDHLVRLVVKSSARDTVQGRLAELGFKVSDLQDVTADDGTSKEGVLKMSAIYRPSKEKIGDFGEKIGGKRADTYQPRDLDPKDLPGDNEKAVEAILRSLDKKRLVTAEMPGQSFGQFMFMEALWERANPPGEFLARALGTYNMAAWKQSIIDHYSDAKDRVKVLELAKKYADTLTAVQKLVDGKQRVGETADALMSGLAQPNGENTELGKDFVQVWRSRASYIVSDLRRKFESTEDSTDQTNREVKKDDDPAPLAEIIRKGKDWRKGAAVTPEKFQEAFGFRGVDFGNWMTVDERQAGLNYSYDAFMDLADMLGLPPKAMGLGGWLAFGIGSRGKGGRAAATFHHDNNVINLTKTKGNGTVYHEWLHALEKYLRDQEDGAGKEHTDAVREAIRSKPALDKLEPLFRNKLSEDASVGRDRNVPPKERAIKWAQNDMPQRGDGWWTSGFGILNGTKFLAHGLEMDGGIPKYWATPNELFARAWEAFTYDESKGKTPYGVGPHVADGVWTKKNGFKGTAYPEAAERAYIAEVMKMFVEALHVSDTGAITIKPAAINVRDRQIEKAKAELARLVKDVDKIMEEMGIRQYPEVKDGSMTESMFYHMRFGWWPKDKHELKKFVAQAHKKEMKDVDDLLANEGQQDFEAAMARYAGQLIQDWRKQGLDDRAIYDKLFDLYNTQPLLDIKTSSTVMKQQFSTPLPIGYIAGLLGHVDTKTVIYDPTAGNGMLGITANPKKFIANELDDRRYKNLTILETRAHHGDALDTHDRNVYKAQEADTVLMNPPFGLMTDPQKTDQDHIIKKLDHWIAVNNMDAMADKGRAVLILGGGSVHEPGVINQNELDFFHWLWTNYNVVDLFEITGKVYRRQGAQWPIRVVVIAGRSPSKLPRPVSGKIDHLETRDDIWTRVVAAREKARDPVAGGIPKRVVGPGAKPGRDGGEGRTGDGGSGVSPRVPGQTGGSDGRPGAGTGPAVDTELPGAVQPGDVLPGGSGPGDVGAQPRGPTGIPIGQPGGLRPGERGAGGEGGTGAAGTQPVGTTLGGSGLTDQDLDDIFGDVSPTGPKKPKIKTKRVGGEQKPRAPKKTVDGAPQEHGGDDTSHVGEPMGPEPTANDGDLVGAFDAIDAILNGRATAPKPFPQKKSGSSSRALVAAQHKTIENRVASEGAWWVSEIVDDVLAANPKLGDEDAADVVFMGKKKGPEIDPTMLQKLRPHFEAIWSKVQETAKIVRDAAIAFRDLVVGKWGEQVLAYARAFIAEKMRAVAQVGQKPPVNNAIETVDQVFYQGLSAGQNDGVMMPASQLAHSKRALMALDARLRNKYPEGIDQYVKEMVGYKSVEEMHKHLYGYQVDGIALQIDAMENNKAFIVGDDTGVGKGRQAAALVVWAQKQGLVPIFMTAQDNLYSDLYRDLEGIGFDHPEWIQPTNSDWKVTNEFDETMAEPGKDELTGNNMVNAILKKLNGSTNSKGEEVPPVDMTDPANFLPKGKKTIFTTYAQMQGPWGASRRSLVEKLVKEKRAVLILDESHKAAGDSGVGKWLVKMQAEHQPKVAFFSATFAKRADSLPLYMRTDLRHIAPTPEEVIKTIVEGRAQMQVTVSEMLIEAGQMVRRERSYNGIVPKFDVDEANEAIDTRTMDEVTDRLRAILAANREFNAWASENKEDFQKIAEQIFMQDHPDIWVSNVTAGDLEKNLGAFNFASTVHNYVKQFLLAVKADRIVRHIVTGMNQENHEGTQQKFIVGLENTMEAALDDFTDMEAVKVGDSMEGYSWRSVLSRAERRARTVSLKIVGSKDKRVRIVLPTELIPGHIQASFRRAQEKIAKYESALPASPIDYIRWQLGRNFVWEEGGKVRVGPTAPPGAAKVRPFVTSEITGRDNIVIYDDEGNMTLGKRDDPTKRGTLAGFQNGAIDAAILNISGTTGLSMHPNAKVKDQRVRHMLIAQPLGDINEFKQLSGRTNRTGQVELPLYTFISTALPAEKRPLAVLRKKLRSLTSNTKSATESLQDLDLTDFVNEYGDDVVTRWLREHPEYVDMLALAMPEGAGAVMEDGAMKVSGKISVLEVADQKAFYDEVEHNYENFIKELTASGENKLIRRALPLKAQRLGENELGEGDPHASSPFLKGSFIQKISAATQHEVPPKELLLEQIDASLAGKKPTEVLAALEADLKVPFDEAMNQVVLQIEGLEKQLEDTELPNLERDRVNATIQSVKQKASAFTSRKQQTLARLKNFIPGTVLRIKLDEESYTAVVTNMGYMKPTGGMGNPYAPSRFRVSMALNAPRPRLNLTLARIEAFDDAIKLLEHNYGNLRGTADHYTTDNATKQVDHDFDPTAAKAAGGREIRYVVVGNIPAGFNAVKNKGEIVVFTYDPDGPLAKEYPQGRAGVLLPHKFNPGKDISDNFPIKNVPAGALMLMTPLYRAIVKNNKFEGTGYEAYDALVKRAKEEWIDLEWTAQEAFDIANNGITDNTGAMKITVDGRNPYLEIDLDKTKGAKLSKEIATDAKLIELLGAEFSKRKGRDWSVSVDLTANGRDLNAILEYIKGKYGLSVPLPMRDIYKRIRDAMAARDEGEIKLMGMTVPTEPKGLSDEARKVADNTSGRRLRALRRSVMVALANRDLPEGMFTKGVLPRSVTEGLKEIEDFFGIVVLPFTNNNPEIFDFNGAALKGDQTVLFLNENADAPPIVVAAHEALHLLRQQNEALYQRLVTRIRPMMQEMTKYQAMVTKGRGGTPASWNLTEEELIADILGDAMLDPVFAAKLYGRDPTLFQRVYSFILRVLDNLGIHLRKPRKTHKYVTDLQAARDVIAKVLNEHYSRPPAPADDTIVNFSPEFQEALRKDLEGVLKFMPREEPQGTGSLTVLDKQAGREGMLAAKRFIYNPANAFAKFPVIAALQRFAVHIETDMSKIQRRFMSEFEDLRKKLSDEQWDYLEDILFVGDAEAVEWTEAELREHGIEDEKIIQGYKDFRTLITKVGRLVDMHRRSMLPKYRARKQALLERMRTLRNMTDPEFRALYGQRTRLLANIRAGGTATMNVDQLHVRLDAVESQLNVKREAMDEFQDLQEQVDQIDAILAQTSIRRRVGYVPHKFFGTFAVYRAQEEEVIDPETLEVVRDEAGDPVTRPINVLVAGEHGFFPTQQDAVAAAKKYLADNPNEDLTVRPVQFKFPNSAATTLTDASYWRLMGRMGKQLGLSGQDLKDAMEGVARRRFRRRIAGFTKLRTGVAGFSRDLERVMQAHLTEASRYVYLDKLKYRAINDMERMGLSPFRSSNQQYPTLGPMVEAFLRDMNGQKSTGEAAADEVLDKMMSSKWGSPAVIGGAMGTTAAAAALFGISTNPLIGLLIGSYVGYRFYSSLKHGGEFKTRALTGDMMSDMAHAKLGMLLNVSSGLVNLTQTLVNTLPVLKPKYTMIGFLKFEEALRSYVMGNPNADWRLLERTDAESINKFGEHKGARVMGTGSVKKLFHIPRSKMAALKYLENAKRLGAWASMIAFDSTESLNRGVSFLGGYYRAKDEGKSLGDSFREAEKVMLFTQHNYGKSNKAEIMRNVFARVPLQFKNYVWQQIAFTFDLARKAKTGRSLSEVPFDRDAIAYHLASLFLLTGAIGLPLIGVLAALIKWLFDYDIMDELKKKALEMQAHGKLAAAAATTVARGLPASIFGEDLSSRAGMGEQFMPFDPSNPWGPWLGTVKNQIAMGEMQAGFIDQLQSISPAAKPFKAMEAMANGMPARDLILRPKQFFEALADDRIDWTNPWKNGYTEYDQTMISKRDVVRMGMGSTPTTVSELRDVEKIAIHETDKHKRKTRLYVNRVIAAARRYESDPAELNKVLDNVAAQMEKDNFAVSSATMQQSYRNAFTPRVLRTLKSVPRGVKPEIAGMIEPLMDRQKPAAEEARP